MERSTKKTFITAVIGESTLTKAIISIVAFIISGLISLKYLGLTLTSMQLACFVTGAICLLLTLLLITRSFQPLAVISVGCVMLLLVIVAEYFLFQYSKNLFNSPLKIIRVADYLEQHRYLPKLVFHASFLSLQTLLVLIFAKGAFTKKLLACVISYAVTVLVICLFWNYGLDDQTKLSLAQQIGEELLKIYADFTKTDEYKVFEILLRRVQELKP